MTTRTFQVAREQLRSLVDHVLDSVSAKQLFQQQKHRLLSHQQIGGLVNENTRNSGSPVTIIGIGKMADAMAVEFVTMFDVANVRGVISSPYESKISPINGLEYFRGGHPIPNEHSITAAKKAKDLLASVAPDDPVIYLISGGGSACFELLEPSLKLPEIQEIYRVLVGCGADISQINRIRQKLSQVKGGKLAAACQSKKQLALIVSDVATSQLQFVSSGPTIYFEEDPAGIEAIITQHKIASSFSTAAQSLLSAPKSTTNNKSNNVCESICLGSNDTAIAAAESFCRSLGWQVEVDQRFDEQPISQAVSGLIESLTILQSKNRDVASCVIAGGEVISKVTGSGRGGRNQAFVLECVPKIANRPIVVLSFGTDGIDGNSPAAGAIADGQTASIANSLTMRPFDYAANSNAFDFFTATGDTIITGPTQINVCDVRVLVSFPEPDSRLLDR